MLRKVGTNLNRLTMLANMGKIQSCDLDSTNKLLKNIYEQLLVLTKEKKKRANNRHDKR